MGLISEQVFRSKRTQKNSKNMQIAVVANPRVMPET